MLQINERIYFLQRALEELAKGFSALPSAQPEGTDRMEEVLRETARRLQDNYPYFHPLYAGQMLKPPHPVAWAAYALAMIVNPNNHALDGGRASSAMEKEAVADIARMFGWEQHLGHLTSGGTMANLEALWIGAQLQPSSTVVASSQAHYTHSRISQVLARPFEAIRSDSSGRMDPAALRERLDRGGVGMVVATIGATATGAVDPLPELLRLRDQYGFRLHADAAYGGYFGLVSNLDSHARAAFDCLGDADSIVIDPHKHGLQPYGCGCILFRDPSVGRFYKHDSPYTYFSSAELHLGEISLECSRPGAAAVALWATQKLLPAVAGSEFAQRLEASRAAALQFHKMLRQEPRFVPAFTPELDIVVWMPRASNLKEASAASRSIFEACAKRGLHLALAELPADFFDLAGHAIERDQSTVTCLRSVLMKPEHQDWLPKIWEILMQSM